jgi:hypothetical protein
MQFVCDSKSGGYNNDADQSQLEYDVTPRSASPSPMPLSARTFTSMAESQTDSISLSFLPANVEQEFYTQNRELVCDDALVWLDSFADNSLPGCVFTSLPDISEVPDVSKGWSTRQFLSGLSFVFSVTSINVMCPCYSRLCLQMTFRFQRDGTISCLQEMVHRYDSTTNAKDEADDLCCLPAVSSCDYLSQPCLCTQPLNVFI